MAPYISDLLQTIPLGRCALLTPLYWQFLTSLETFVKRSFSVFGPTVWNSLPLSLRKTRQCFTTFKTKLKIHLFHIHLCRSASDSFCMRHSGGVCVCDHRFVWLGLFMHMLIPYVGLWVIFKKKPYLVGCFSMTGHLLFWVSYMHVFCICNCSAQLSMFHMERRPRNMLIVIIN